MNEAGFLALLKQMQAQYASEALRTPGERTEFEYGYRCGIMAGYERAIGHLLDALKDEEARGADL